MPAILSPNPELFATRVLHITATTTAATETVTVTRMTVSAAGQRIVWGDGTSDVLPVSSIVALTHVYAAAGVYPITVTDARYITQLQLDNAKLGGLNTAELSASAITYFYVTLITGSTIRSADMTVWRPTIWYLLAMPAGTYSIASADIAAWRPTTWQLYNMPAGTYNIASADMAAWRPTTWYLHSMSAGTYSIASADMAAWRPTVWYLLNMPAAGSSYTFAASCMRAWTALATLRADGLALDAATVDLILADLYAGRMGYTAAAPTANLGGTNADPTGVYQAMVPPTTGLETKFELVNDSAAQGYRKWGITT
jgi:hypothetical protein